MPEIALRLDLPIGTVKSRMRIGLEKMERLLRAEGYPKHISDDFCTRIRRINADFIAKRSADLANGGAVEQKSVCIRVNPCTVFKTSN